MTRPNVSVERALDELVETVPAAIRKAGLADNACILATRLGVEALRRAGLRARALSVGLTVMNAAYLDALERQDADPDTKITGEELRAMGAWLLVVGSGGNGGWNGHLVTIVEERYLLDPTAHQLKRLHKNIDAEPLWTEARELAQDTVFGLKNQEDGAVWLYEPRRQDKSFLNTPSWSAYRVSVRSREVVSERVRLRDVPGAVPEVRIPIPGRSNR